PPATPALLPSTTLFRSDDDEVEPRVADPRVVAHRDLELLRAAPAPAGALGLDQRVARARVVGAERQELRLVPTDRVVALLAEHRSEEHTSELQSCENLI